LRKKNERRLFELTAVQEQVVAAFFAEPAKVKLFS